MNRIKYNSKVAYIHNKKLTIRRFMSTYKETEKELRDLSDCYLYQTDNCIDMAKEIGTTIKESADYLYQAYYCLKQVQNIQSHLENLLNKDIKNGHRN